MALSSPFDVRAQRVSYTLESSLEGIVQAERGVGQFVMAAGIVADTRYEILMAMREAVVNAVQHGNAGVSGGKIHLTCECQPGSIEIAVRDQGRGFDFERVPDPLAPGNRMKTSGRGIFLMRNFMDEVQFRNLHPGLEIILRKHVRGGAADVGEKLA